MITNISPGSVFGFFDITLTMPVQAGISATFVIKGVSASVTTNLCTAMMAGTTLALAVQ